MPAKRKPRTKTTQKQSQRQSVVVHIHAPLKQNRRRRQTTAPQRRPAANSISYSPSLAVQMPSYPSYPAMYSPQQEIARPNILVPPAAAPPVPAFARETSIPTATPLEGGFNVPRRVNRRTRVPFYDSGINTDENLFKDTKSFTTPKSYPDIQKAFEKTEDAKDNDNSSFLGVHSYLGSHKLFGTPSPEQAAVRVGENELLLQTNAANADDYEIPQEKDDIPIHRLRYIKEPESDMSDAGVQEKIQHYERMRRDVLLNIAAEHGISERYTDANRKSQKKNRRMLAEDIVKATGGGKAGN